MKIRSIRFIREIRVGFEREPGVRRGRGQAPPLPDTLRTRALRVTFVIRSSALVIRNSALAIRYFYGERRCAG